MKKFAFLIMVVISFLFASCDKSEDIPDGFETILEADMPVSSQKSSSIVSDSDVYNFVGSSIFTLADNTDIEQYINNIQNIIALDGSLIQFNKAVDGNKIMTIHMKYGIQTAPDVEPSLKSGFSFSGQLLAKDGAIKYLNDSWSPILVGSLLANKDKVFVIKIEGTANYNVKEQIKIKVPVKVGTSPM